MNAREQRFCEEYMVDLNARAAAERAGYKPGTARQAGCWVDGDSRRAKPEVMARVDALRDEQSRRTGITADRVLAEYARIAFANIADITDGVRLLDDAGRDDLAAVASVKVKQGSGGTDCDVRMYDKLKALDMLGRHLGMFVDGEAGGEEGMPKVTLHPDGSVTIEN